MDVLKLLMVFVIYALLIGGVAVVFIRLWGGGAFPSQQRGFLQVLDRIALAPNKGLILVKVSEKVLLIAVSDKEMQVLSEFDGSKFQVKEEPPRGFNDIMRKLIPKISEDVGTEGDKPEK